MSKAKAKKQEKLSVFESTLEGVFEQNDIDVD